MCGPEMINTLEQLKISLDNLKNSMHPKKESSETDPKKIIVGTANQQQFIAAAVTTFGTQQQPMVQMPQIPPQQQNVVVTQPPVAVAQQPPPQQYAPPPQQNLILQQQPNYQQPVSQASPPQMLMNIQQKPVEAAPSGGVMYQQPQTTAMTGSVSVQNLSMQAQPPQQQQQQQFQHSISVDDNALTMHQGFAVKKLPLENLKQISERYCNAAFVRIVIDGGFFQRIREGQSGVHPPGGRQVRRAAPKFATSAVFDPADQDPDYGK
jgi:hypothetical protein